MVVCPKLSAYKPKDQREFIRFGLARNRTFKNNFVKPKDQREFIRFGLARNRTFKNQFALTHDFDYCSYIQR